MKRKAERRKRLNSQNKFNNSVIQSAGGLNELSKNLQGAGVRGRAMPGSILVSSENQKMFSDNLKNMDMKDRAKKYKDQPGGGDYLKQIINQGTRGFGGSTSTGPVRNRFNKQPLGSGPSYGQSKLGYGTQSNSGRSNSSMGGGLASRFSLALSRVIDSNTTTSAGLISNKEDEDMQEIIQLIEELNKHSDLTVKLSNQSKICSIFQKNPNKSQSLMKKKFEQNLKDLDPKIRLILEKCRVDLEQL